MIQLLNKYGQSSIDDGKVIVIDKYGKIKTFSGGAGTGTVTSVSAGNLSPLFNTSVANPTTTPALSFSQISQAQNLFYASPNGSSGNPAFRAIVAADLPSLSSVYVPVSRTLTINGVTYDLSADRTWTIPTFTSPLTTKGDIYVRNALADTRLPVGLDTQVLIADSSQSTGLKWGSNTAPTPLGYYGGWQDTTTQTAAAPNVGYAMMYNTQDVTPNGISIVNDLSGNPTRITFANTGIYNLQFSSQFENTDNAEHDVTIWLRKNSVDVPGSSGFVQVDKRRSAGAGNEGHIVVAWNYLLSVVGGEYYEIVWSTTSSTFVTMKAYPAGSPPPSTASVILTVTQQSGIMAGTGITAINSLTGAVQTLSTGTSGTDFAISSSGTTHTFNLPIASGTNTGKLSSTDWTTFNSKQAALVSGTNIKTLEGINTLGIGDLGYYNNLSFEQNFGYMIPIVGATTYSSLRATTNIIQSAVSADFTNTTPRMLYATITTAGNLAFQRGTTGGTFTFATTLKMYWKRRFQIDSNISGARFVCGLSNAFQLAAPTNVEPDTLINTIGVCKLSSSNNLFFFWNDATGTATTVDLGVNYPANNVTAYTYDLEIFKEFSTANITLRLTRIDSSGNRISTTQVISTNYNNAVSHSPVIYTTNNATTGSSRFYDYGTIFKNYNLGWDTI
jgi:hypothetical protein